MKKVLTLCFALQDGKILLGMKKRGFGMGRWNGFGGKVEADETIETAAVRETKEECGITIQSMEKVGIHEFKFASKREEVLEVHVFRIDEFIGDPIEMEEMRPAWYAFADIPYAAMWPDDRFWMPVFLTGKKFRTKFLFGEKDQVLEKDIIEVENI